MRSKLLRYAALAVLTTGLLFWVTYKFLFPTLPAPIPTQEISWMDQGWSADQREKFYQTPQGSLIIPYSWFLALEQPEPGNHELFRSDENLMRYALVPDVKSRFNPDGLPVGLAKQSVSGDQLAKLGCGHAPCPEGASLHKEWLSYTCAACHTARLTYKGKHIGIDGGRGQWNFTVFNTTLANLLLVTRWTPPMFDRFAERVLKLEGKPDRPEERAAVKKALQEFLESPAIEEGIKGELLHTYPTVEGYGRMDALGRGANGQFLALDKRNVLIADAPVVIPPLWNTHDYDWVQTVTGIRQPLGRNITESWGVASVVNLTDPEAKHRFATTIQFRDIFWIETLISVMTAPVWPEAVFGKPDADLVKLGKYLYEEKVWDGAMTPVDEQWCGASAAGKPGSDGWQPCPNASTGKKGLCARCHAPVLEQNANEYGKKFWQLPLYKLDVIGTDPKDAVNFNARQVYTGVLASEFGGREKVGVGEALLVAVGGILKHGMEYQKIPEKDRATTSGYRMNDFRAPLGYPARPLQGYWATPPFLHNGSVPNLYALLSPLSERPSSFWIGSLEFDPVNVGYENRNFSGAFEFETRRSVFGALADSLRRLAGGRLGFERDIDGNSNAGHEFRNAAKGTKGVVGPLLSPQERRAIIEYMKVMPGLQPPAPEELDQRRALLKGMESEYEGKGK